MHKSSKDRVLDHLGKKWSMDVDAMVVYDLTKDRSYQLRWKDGELWISSAAYKFMFWSTVSNWMLDMYLEEIEILAENIILGEIDG